MPQQKTISRVAIVNRGEAAMRLIHAVRDMNAAQPDAAPIEVIALHTTGEAGAMFVREADVTYDLGPASSRPYINLDVLEKALVDTRADAAWVGWGFVAEDPAFAELCDKLGVTFIGPIADAMRQLGDKIGSKLIAEEVGVPVAPWSRGGLDSLEQAQKTANEIGYPLMLKATAGGGGRGITKVSSDAELADVYERTRGEAERAFGSGVVFLESLVTGARHVEVQVIADAHGTAWALGVRDCTVQRRNQKVIEESASPLLTPERVAEVKASAERLAVRVGYVGACTVEFLYQPEDDMFAFLEVNTRLQVEHPITEVTTRTDLVKLQFHVATGGALTGDRPEEIGHAVEARLNAEDADRDFAPAPGHIDHLALPQGPGIRVDTGVAEGDTIPADFDSMIAKVIAFGADRDEALARLRRAMSETEVVIDGGTTNKSFILELLDQPEVTTGEPVWSDTGWIDRVRGEGRLNSTANSGAALVVAGIEAHLAAEQIERARFYDTARRGRPLASHELGRPVELKLRGTTHAVRVLRTGPELFDVTITTAGVTEQVQARFDRLDEFTARLEIGGETHRVLLGAPGPVQMIEVDGQGHRVSRDEGGVLRSQAPALVVATPVAEGDVVAAGDRVIVLESMKMETIITAPFAARVKEIPVRAGTQVETGAPIARLEPLGDGAETAEEASESVDLGLPECAPATPDDERQALRAVVLGYDTDPGNPTGPLKAYLADREPWPTPVAAEAELLETFADLTELHRNSPAAGGPETDSRVHTTREWFQRYLNSLDVEREQLPSAFADRLQRVLAHYGIDSLDHSEQLEQAVYRIFLVQQNWSPATSVVTGILQAWRAQDRPAGAGREVRLTLDRLVVATQRRFPAIGDLARSIRYRWFEKPAIEAEQAAALAQVPELLGHLEALPDGPARRAVTEELVGAPDRMVGFLRGRAAHEVPAEEPLLEVLTQRHYRGYQLSEVDARTVAGRAVTTADYVIDGRATHITTTVGNLAEFVPGSPLVQVLDELCDPAFADEANSRFQSVDLYLLCEEADASDSMAERLAEALSGMDFFCRLRRIAIAMLPLTKGTVGYFTFRCEDGKPVEDAVRRGFHPMVARQLNLNRLSDFALSRLESPRNILLLDAVAKDNPNDERIVAMTQVRRLSLVRDEQGQVTGVPHLERALITASDAVRRARAEAAPAKQLDHNHVWIHVWGEFDVDLGAMQALERQLAPITADAGISEVRIETMVPRPGSAMPVPTVVRFSHQPGFGVRFQTLDPTEDPLPTASRYDELVLRARRRGLVYPYELFGLVASSRGRVVELDLDESGALVEVDREPGRNSAGIIVADVTTPTAVHPEGVRRIILFGDPLKALGAIGRPEADRIVAALDRAESLGVPVDWFTLSSGARISMESGTENMDAVAHALKRIVEFTQDGREINVVVAGINVGAQPYWNAEATMLMHTKGILVMTPDSAMVLTGKQSLDFSGGVSAEDNFGIGGYDRVMGPNGQAQYWAPDLAGAQAVLMRHYEHAYIAPGEDRPRDLPTSDVDDRDISTVPHKAEGSDFATVGEIFSVEKNRERKKAFDIRTVMRALADADHEPLERWATMADAETSVVYDTTIGGMPITLLGIESKATKRPGMLPADGPDQFTAGTLFPRSSKKTARALNAASGNRPVVVLANLSGFDGSPESMRNLQLEYGAEIGRAIVNFDGPIVFVVISRYHGGAFVVFSKALNPNMTVLALEGSYASVIGGAPAAAVVFARDVAKRVDADPRVAALKARMADASDAAKAGLKVELDDLRETVKAETISTVANEFDGVHDIHRAVRVGSVDEVITVPQMRPRIIEILRAARS